MSSLESLDRILDAESRAAARLRPGEELLYERVQKRNGLYVCDLRVKNPCERIDCSIHFKQMYSDSDWVKRVLHDGPEISPPLFLTARNLAKDIIRIVVEIVDGDLLHHFGNVAGGNSDHRSL